MKYLMGIDNGGTFSKAALFDKDGTQAASYTHLDVYKRQCICGRRK